MSAEPVRRKVTLNALRRKKAAGERITSIGSTTPMAAIADRVGFDLLVVGNAGPMSLLAHPDPTTVTFEEQLFLTRAVRAAWRASVSWSGTCRSAATTLRRLKLSKAPCASCARAGPTW
ncbi:3-methyl-2-oxobutanoate hydroxymethyltransferase [Chenggangzhangella methanolivorans]|uniref:3-methyl-2-oxobutanoate hydroxymethyltransferase n=1 Tax=Chenggangzhangella methanolivorans TaxID=1437009 RepID=A0A9E6UH29_9HYPH|nr:3-methyl-2-oxobutanoate hydroxymethyltransferase [Chenggangzhangella methanolivorans]QZN99357.1 3-methyl-2-oxobutanoate hydroxymethyltransferase [Chenggangzhangella methanolivorans]